MEITRDNLLSLIQSRMKREGLNITSLEKRAGVPKDTVRDFLRGKTQILRADKLQKILRVIEPSRKVAITGYVGANAVITATEAGKDKETVDCPPGFDPVDLSAVRIKGDAMSPVFLDGWVIYYTLQHHKSTVALSDSWQVPYNRKDPAGKTAKEVPEPLLEFLGKPCVLKLADGRLILRTLKPGKTPGHYTLVSYNATDIENVALEWAARIVYIKTE
jgi:transcriptional regulator with XRE-family HTH domain